MNAVLDVVDPALPALAAVFDPAELSALFARPVQADRVRHKRGVSAVARLRSAPGTTTSGEPAPQWLAAYAAGHVSKLDKTLKRAADLGYLIEVLERGDGSAFVAGPIGLDMKLHRVLRPFARDGRVEFGPGSVLNYNPHRRMVFRLETSLGTVVCKAGEVGPGVGSAEARFLADLTARGVPVLQRASPADAPSGDGLRYYPWFGQGDLQAASHRGADALPAAHAAGTALAALHAQPLDLASGLAGISAHGAGQHDAVRKLGVVAERNTRLLPAGAARLDALHARIARRITGGSRSVLAHGDFSADQVLVDRGDILLADFDRITTAPSALDVGGFVASDLLQERVTGRRLRAAFLDGYAAAGGDPQDGDLAAWVAAQLFDRLNEPFRACSPDWRAEMTERLDLLEQVLAGDVI